MDDAILQQAVRLYKDAVESDKIRGAVLLIARHGTIVVHEAVGWKNYAYRLPMERDTIFQMASTTKPLTATAVLMLEEAGKLSTSDVVSKYFDSFGNEKSRRITIKQIASGTSGFRGQPIMYPFEERDGPPTLRAAVDKFGAIGPKTAPDTSFSYSNAGFNILGALIEHVSGMPLELFWSSGLYEPLGMTDTSNHSDPVKWQRMATHYGARRGPDGTVHWSRGYTPGDPPEYPVVRASGGLVTTALDYARFLQMWLDEGRYPGGRLLSRESVKKATTPIISVAACPASTAPCNTLTPFDKTDGLSYAMGWYVDERGVFSHLGGSANNGRYVWADPSRDLLGVALTTGGSDPREAFQQLVEKAVVEP
jgi:CubicO group peptidase (beta-lactamase class C family)